MLIRVLQATRASLAMPVCVDTEAQELAKERRGMLR